MVQDMSRNISQPRYRFWEDGLKRPLQGLLFSPFRKGSHQICPGYKAQEPTIPIDHGNPVDFPPAHNAGNLQTAGITPNGNNLFSHNGFGGGTGQQFKTQASNRCSGFLPL